jgi:SAM-dependent methyltransferase
LNILDQIFFPFLRPEPYILDLCCGDGRVMLYLRARGYRVCGLDGSEEMLRYARERLPDAPIHLADARDFSLPEPVDAVLSTFDSLNHVMSGEELRQVFDCVFASLRPGGRFVFDLNREVAYRTLWVLTGATVEEDKVYVARGAYHDDTRVATCDVTVFRKLNEWVRSDFRLRQKCHSREEVVNALTAAGFTGVEVLDARDRLGMRGSIGLGRDYFVATRPAAET